MRTWPDPARMVCQIRQQATSMPFDEDDFMDRDLVDEDMA